MAVTISSEIAKIREILSPIWYFDKSSGSDPSYIENEQLRYEILKRLLIKLIRKEINEEEFLKLKRSLD